MVDDIWPRPSSGLGCTDTPFLASCQCRTHVGHWYGYDSPDSGVRRVSLFFFFFFRFSDTALTRLQMAPTRLRHASSGKKKRKITDVWPLTSARCRCCCPPSLAGARSSRSASCSSLLLLLLLLFLFLFLCSLTQMPSSSSSSASFTFSFSVSFILTFLILFYISFLFCGSSANPTWKSL